MIGPSLVIRGGDVVTPQGIQRVDIVVRDQKIIGVEKGIATDSETSVLDASGYHVLPGLVDIHVHLRDPGFTAKEDFYSGTRAAAAGGVTTVIAQPNTTPAITDLQSLAVVREEGSRKAVVDFGIAPALRPDNLSHLPDLAATGAVYFDIAPKDWPPALLDSSRDNRLASVLGAAAAVGRVVAIFASNQAVAYAATAKVKEARRNDLMALADAYSEEIEVSAVETLFRAVRKSRSRVHLKMVR